MAISTKTYPQLLGELVRRILPNTPLNDISVGSALYTLLEAIAASDFDNNASILSVLDLLTLDALTNNDLDNRAADYGITRLVAQRASGLIKITDSTITKRSTGLYAIKPAPIAGSLTLYINDATNWAPTGFLYIGRGTQSFEGPIPYTSITNNGSFFTVTLGATLQKDHLISDVVVDQQGKLDRLIPAGTAVKIPANNQMPDINYIILRDAIIPAGEDTVDNVSIIAERAGSFSNASIGTIVQFESAPFVGATVTNTSALTDGRDIESDAELRERVKAYSSTLARGTADAILTSIIGVADSEEGKQVVSAVISEPPTIGEPSIAYLDDGRGFQPSTKGQSVDVLLASANGNEEFLQLANYPLPRPQAINTADGPYELINGMTLYVYVDDVEESVEFKSNMFNNISSATLSEIVIAINDTATSFKCRLANNSSRLLIYPASSSAETIQVIPLRTTDDEALFANTALKFPTNTFSYISLYRNNELLKERETSASLLTVPFPDWDITASGNIVLSVDNTPPQDRLFTTSDFGGKPINSTTIEEWVEAFNLKFAGLTAAVTSSGAMSLTSNRSGNNSKLEILSGSYVTKMFADNPKTSTGQQSDFDLNRQTGNLRIKTGIAAGDSITAGTSNAKGSVISSTSLTGSFNVSSDSNNRASNALISIDDTSAKSIPLSLVVGSTVVFSIPSAGILRVMANSLSALSAVQPRDFFYITYRTTGSWVSANNAGLFRVTAVGGHTIAGVDSYIDVECINGVAESKVLLAVNDMLAFRTSTYPQIWEGSSTNIPAAASIADVLQSIEKTITNIDAAAFKTSSIKTTSASETEGSIAVLGTTGTASAVFPVINAQAGNQSHIAHKTTSKDLLSYPKRSNLWQSNLGRMVTSELSGLLTADSQPATNINTEPYEALITSLGMLSGPDIVPDDIISVTSGSNKGLLRSIKDLQAGGVAGTQHALPRARLPFMSGNAITIFKSLSFTPEDNIVFIVDQDSVNKTVVVPMSRTGRIHSMFPFTNLSFSAYDHDNEPGVTFDSVPVWGTNINGTDFRDYAIWFKARNWYVSGGAGSGLAGIFIRAAEYGPHGEKISFSLEYPSSPDQEASIQHINRPTETHVECVMASGSARAIGIVGGLQFGVTDLTGGMFRFTFMGPIDLSGVAIGDIVGIANTSGVSINNRGNYRVYAKGINYIDIYNPNGAATGAGTQEVVDVTCGPDTIGTPTEHTIQTVGAGSLDGTYFTLNDDIGKVAYWYDVDNNGTPAPTVSGAYRYVRIGDVITGDTANTVANKTSYYIDIDTKFSATVALNTITVVNQFNGDTAAGSAGTSGFTVTKTISGTSDNSLEGKYFIIQDEDGSVAVWYNVSGIAPEPFHGANRSVMVSTVAYGDSSAVVATKTAALLSLWSPSVLGSTITLTDPVVGGRNSPSVGTLGSNSFSLLVTTNGANADPETIVIPTAFNIYPLTANTVKDIIDVINTSSIIEAVPLSSDALKFEVATRDEQYTPGTGYEASLSYNHDPDPISGKHAKISLFDAQSWVKSFQNVGPNFILKDDLVLSVAAPLAYNMATVPNRDTSDLGEMFKLIPTTLANVKHQFSQKALSQLPIVSEIDVASAYKSIQIKSKKLGSDGAIEIVGGRANLAEFSIFGEAQNITESGTTFTEVKTAAYPITLNVGDYVEVSNTNAVKRRKTISSADKVNVAASVSSATYSFQGKALAIAGESVEISDVSSSYGKGAGTVWRWEFTDGDFSTITLNDVLIARGLAWSRNNQSLLPNSMMTGFPILAVNNTLKHVDILNPRGEAMASTPIGAGTIIVAPAPAKRWHLRHSASINIETLSIVSGVATVFTSTQHGFADGDVVSVLSGPIDGNYTVTIIDDLSFQFSIVLSNATYFKGNCRRAAATPTRYTIESLGGNDFFRLQAVGGDTPNFIECGVACDDVVVIQGLTFKNSNTGRFRVYAATEDSLIFQNTVGTEELDTIRPLNPFMTAVTWTANVDTITGTAGSFRNVTIGSWIKKSEDPSDYFVQVIGMDAVPASATQLFLGSNYKGTSSVSHGVVFHMTNDVNQGVILADVDDIVVFEGDSAFPGDSLFVDDIVHDDWFSIQNTGTFEVQQVTLNNAWLPTITVLTNNALSETDILMSVNGDAMYFIEGPENKTTLVKEIRHIAIDEFDPNRRVIYLHPSNFSEKLSQMHGTKIRSTGKMGYSSDVVTGIDGYLYYTGLMRKVQRIVDGFEPDAANYPGRRAVGSSIELLPPLIRRVKMSLEVTTNEGVNLNEISNDIVSTIIGYVAGLGVGRDVILSEVIVQVMSIRGVAAVTFTQPTPSQERIPISDMEKAFIESSDISIA